MGYDEELLRLRSEAQAHSRPLAGVGHTLAVGSHVYIYSGTHRGKTGRVTAIEDEGDALPYVVDFDLPSFTIRECFRADQLHEIGEER